MYCTIRYASTVHLEIEYTLYALSQYFLKNSTKKSIYCTTKMFKTCPCGEQVECNDEWLYRWESILVVFVFPRHKNNNVLNIWCTAVV